MNNFKALVLVLLGSLSTAVAEPTPNLSLDLTCYNTTAKRPYFKPTGDAVLEDLIFDNASLRLDGNKLFAVDAKDENVETLIASLPLDLVTPCKDSHARIAVQTYPNISFGREFESKYDCSMNRRQAWKYTLRVMDGDKIVRLVGGKAPAECY